MTKLLLDSVRKRFIEFRKQENLSQKEIAIRIGTTQSRISYFESGNRKLDFEDLIALAQNFKLSFDWLLLGTGEMHITEENSVTQHELFEEVKLLNRYVASLEENNKVQLEVIQALRKKIERSHL